MFMVRHGHAHRHLHKKPKKDWLDYVLYVFMIATPLFELPQAWDIYSTHSAQDVSITTWGFFWFVNIAWIIYALRNKLRILVVTYLLYAVIEMAIVVGIILYS
jgi:uncharacterized protein with PQ loop repeat